jgi:tetratricopeptide (TPR) repeat protein
LEESLKLAEATGTATYRWSLINLGELECRVGNVGRAAALLEEALQLALDAADILQAAQSERGLGDTALAAGDVVAAERNYQHALSLAQEFGSRRAVAFCLAGLASVAAKRGEPERAGRFWAASEAFQWDFGFELLAFERLLYDEALATVVGPEFEHAVNATRARGPDEALTAALAD